MGKEQVKLRPLVSSGGIGEEHGGGKKQPKEKR